MIKGKKILGIIPARGGSKGISNKNIKPLAGKPLIVWAIEKAKKSKYVDKLIVSTDSEEIYRLARAEGAEIPFLRPTELASDTATATEVILHILDWFEKNDDTFDYFIYLQPTSPLRTNSQIDEAIELLINHVEANSLVSVSVSKESPYWMRKVDDNGYLIKFIKSEKEYDNRQELPIVYTINGSIYICDWNVFVKEKSFEKGNCLPFVMDKISGIDIDTLDDWEFAEYIINKEINKGSR